MSDAAADNAAGGSVSTPRFVHLRVHSAYSLLEGALPLGKVIKQAIADQAPAIAVTDTNNLFGALEFAQKASKDGVQPIIGCQVDVAFGDHNDNGRSVNRRLALDLAPLVLLASTEEGYANIVRLVSRSFLDTPAGDPVHIDASWLPALAKDVIVLSGGPLGPIGRSFAADRPDRAQSRLAFLHEIFGNRLYVELQRYAGYDRALEAKTVALAYEMELPLVATNEAFFLKAEDYEAHDALLAIAEGQISPMTTAAA